MRKAFAQHLGQNRVRTSLSGPLPTPPYMRVRIRRLRTSFKSSRCREDSSRWIVGSAATELTTSRWVLPKKLQRELLTIRTCSLPSGLRRPRGSNTMPSADFWSHRTELPQPPRLSGKPYSRVRFQISPDKIVICPRPSSRSTSAPSSGSVSRSAARLTWSRRPRIGFLFVTWRVLARM